jgi:hypothetical protein
MELIPQIGSAPDPLPLVKQFVQYVHERKLPLSPVLIRLYNALRSKSHRQRANIALALFQLFRRFKPEPNRENLYEESKRILWKDYPQIPTTDTRLSFLSPGIQCFGLVFPSELSGAFANGEDVPRPRK